MTANSSSESENESNSSHSEEENEQEEETEELVEDTSSKTSKWSIAMTKTLKNQKSLDGEKVLSKSRAKKTKTNEENEEKPQKKPHRPLRPVHMKPKTDHSHEKALKKIAQKGMVQLFNAVAAQKKACGGDNFQEIKKETKKSFLNALMSGKQHQQEVKKENIVNEMEYDDSDE